MTNRRFRTSAWSSSTCTPAELKLEGIELTFELISTCSGWYTVGDDLKVRVSFAQVSSELGEELANYVGERFYIEASNNGECWSGPVPASGDIEAELV